MTVEVRNVTESELPQWLKAKSAAFFEAVNDADIERPRNRRDLDRTWGAFDGNKVVGTLRSFASELTVPGCAPVTAAALTAVTVAATHRRRGVLREMITTDLRLSRERGEPVGILIASEWPIYGRFGYGPATEGATYEIDSARAHWTNPAEGDIDLVDDETFAAHAAGLYNSFRVTQPGAIDRTDAWWIRLLADQPETAPRAKRGERYLALYRSTTGNIEGYIRYHAEPVWDQMSPRSVLDVDELIAVTPDAYRRMWQYCCEVDLVRTAKAHNRSVSEPLIWSLNDGRAVRQVARFDFIWVRILDVPCAFSARDYGASGAVVIEVVDPLGLAGGRFALESGPDGGQCEATRSSADISIGVAALGSTYLGGASLETLFRAGLVDEHRSGAVKTADMMLRSDIAPWCNTWF